MGRTNASRENYDIDLNEFSRLIRNSWEDKFPESDPPDNGQVLNLAKTMRYDIKLCMDTLFDMSDDGITTFNGYMKYCKERMKTKSKSESDFAVDENTGVRHEIHIDKDRQRFYYAPKPRNDEDARLMGMLQLTPEIAIDRDMDKETRNEMMGKQIEYLHKTKQFTDEMYRKAMIGLDIMMGIRGIDLQSDIKVDPDLF